MTTQKFLTVVAAIFLIIAVAHLVRIFYGWDVLVGGVKIPLWVSWFPVLIGGYLAFTSFRLNK